ncbi:PH domain-containing protein [Streptomyces sp. DSM 44917]|uniref:PH domain-containing protein n=1 Tax=Streptomyces boetiae TaxID=3075541 RepID=A0ABU2LDT2_9ACTN|nr:PH domain-containing protein [Streptomyces sp. DSM 44917]MDT0309433.1 PH domain-containing protein [Streptomyces sp. DSM 44917]
MSAPTPGAAAAPPALPVTFRPVLTRVVLHVIGATVCAVLVLISFLLPSGGAVGWGAGDRAAVAGAGVLVWGVLAVLTRPRVVADAEGVTVVNLTTTRRLAWPEVLRVTLRPGDPWVTLDLADGTVLAVMAIQPGVGRAAALAAARTLRSLAEAHGERPEPPPS